MGGGVSAGDVVVKLSFDLRHGKVVGGGVSAGDVVVKLSFDVGEKSGGTDAEEIRLGPLHAQLLLHQDQPKQSVFRYADPSGRLETHFVPGTAEGRK